MNSLFLAKSLLNLPCHGFAQYRNTRRMAKYKQTPFFKWDILKGDQVVMNAGRDKGKTGKVLKVYRHTNRLLIQDVNVKMKRVKGNDENPGGIKQVIQPVHMSNANLVDPESGRPTRVTQAFLEDGTKVRVAKKSGAIIAKPQGPTYQSRQKDKIDGVKDTDVQTVMQVTYQGEDFGKIKREFEEFILEKERRESLLVFDA